MLKVASFKDITLLTLIYLPAKQGKTLFCIATVPSLRGKHLLRRVLRTEVGTVLQSRSGYVKDVKKMGK